MKKHKVRYSLFILIRRHSLIYPLLLLIAILLLITGCTPTTPTSSNSWNDLTSYHKIEGVPDGKVTIAGKSFSVAAEIIFQSLGLNVGYMDLIPVIQPTLYHNYNALGEYTESKGFSYGVYKGTLLDLLKLISKDVRILAETTTNSGSLSFTSRVPFWYDIETEEIGLKDPEMGGELIISFDDFLNYAYGTEDYWVIGTIYDKGISINDSNLTPYPYSTF